MKLLFPLATLICAISLLATTWANAGISYL